MADLANPVKDLSEGHGIQRAVQNKTIGGTGGTSFDFTTDKTAVKALHVWVDKGFGGWSDRDLIKGIKVVWTDGTSKTAGNTAGDEYDFHFGDEETVTKLNLWTGSRIDKIVLSTSAGREFAKGGTGGAEHSQKVGNGVLLGVKGTYDKNELITLGAKFDENYKKA